MTNSRSDLLTGWPHTVPSPSLLDDLSRDPHVAQYLASAPIADVRKLLAFMLFARENTARFAGVADPDAPLRWIEQVANADPHRRQILDLIMYAGMALTGEHKEAMRAIYFAVKSDPLSVAKQDGGAFKVAGFNPAYFSNLGGARESASATWNGILIREIGDRVSTDVKNRFAIIARLATSCGADVNRQKVRAILMR